MISAAMNQTPAQVWRETQTLLRPQVTRATYETIIQKTRLLPLTNGVYRVQAETAMGQEWLENWLRVLLDKLRLMLKPGRCSHRPNCRGYD